MSQEKLIIDHLILSDIFLRKTYPHLKLEYFQDSSYKNLFKIISAYVDKYNQSPSKEALDIELESLSLGQTEFDECRKALGKVQEEPDQNIDWAIDKCENFCKERALYNALSEAISIVQEDDSNLTKGSIPRMLSEALGVTFDNKVGHDYYEDIEERLAFYNLDEERIAFDIDILNKATKGGVGRQSINIILAPSGVGKSLIMGHFAASYILQGLNVLYITLEMAEKKIAQRIDANILDIGMDKFQKIDETIFKRKIQDLKLKSQGRLVVKEYPTSSANANHFRFLINELMTKKNFKPDVLIVDYLNICAPARKSRDMNSYMSVKYIVEEIRALCMEFNLVGWTATQTNRNGYDNSDIRSSDVSESMGSVNTADMLLAVSQGDIFRQTGRYLFKQLKSRWDDLSKLEKFVVGVDKEKMRLYDVDDNEFSKPQSDVSYEKMTPAIPKPKKKELKGDFS